MWEVMFQLFQDHLERLLELGIFALRDEIGAVIDFDMLEFLRGRGATDYLGYIIPFADDDQPTSNTDGLFGSWATDRKTGFSGRDVRDLIRVQKRLAVACKMQIRREITHNVLTAYLGDDAGRQVLDGRIKRGDGRQVRSVIWYSDLRRSTELADTLEPEIYLELLNRYFECTAGSVLASGGEVLSFIGDAVLAIFPIDDDGDGKRLAAEAALNAAENARERLAALNASRPDHDHINFGIALHVGRVMHGNIGVPERVDFSVIGPAANEVARLEQMTKALGRDVLASRAFADILPIGWEELGTHEVRGSTRPITVLAAPSAN